jgi:hypothetical protein
MKMLLRISQVTVLSLSHWMHLGIHPPFVHWMPLAPLKMVLLLRILLARLKTLLLVLPVDPTLILYLPFKKQREQDLHGQGSTP